MADHGPAKSGRDFSAMDNGGENSSCAAKTGPRCRWNRGLRGFRSRPGPTYVGVVRDVSERRRFDRLQEEFVSALAHDLKNPLTTVRGQTQLLRRRLERGEALDVTRLESALEGIDAAAVRMTRLLDELGDVMRLRAGQEIDLTREPTDLVALVRRSIDEQARTTERHQIRLSTEVEELVGYWDGPRLERVLGNLLGNAIKYSPKGGEIVVRLAREGDGAAATAVLSVTDQGVGIPAKDLTMIFERFRRATNVESIAGTGIGLAGTKRIVRAPRGSDRGDEHGRGGEHLHGAAAGCRGG